MKINNVTPKTQYSVKNQQPTFTGGPNWNKIGKAVVDEAKKWSPKELFEPGRSGNMSRNLFTLNAFVFLLGGRIVKSRDGNEKRETITRDIPTILLAVFGVPAFEKRLAAMMQNKSGFALLNNPKDCVKGIIDSDSTKDLYHLNEQFKSKQGAREFFNRLDRQGANFKKVISHLSDEVKQGISSFSDDNAKFMEKLFHADNKSLLTKVEEGFSKADNAVFKKANFMKSVPKLFGIASTTALIGICIPNLNIFITEMINRNKKAKAPQGAPAGANVAEAKAMQPVSTTPATPTFQKGMKNAHNSSNDSTQKAFSSFLKEEKA